MLNFNQTHRRRTGALVDGIARHRAAEDAAQSSGVQNTWMAHDDATGRMPTLAFATPNDRFRSSRTALTAPVVQPASAARTAPARVNEPDTADGRKTAVNTSPTQTRDQSSSPALSHSGGSVDNVLKGLMQQEAYWKPGDAGNALRDTVKRGFELAYPGRYQPGSWSRDVTPAIGVPELTRMIQASLPAAATPPFVARQAPTEETRIEGFNGGFTGNSLGGSNRPRLQQPTSSPLLNLVLHTLGVTTPPTLHPNRPVGEQLVDAARPTLATYTPGTGDTAAAQDLSDPDTREAFRRDALDDITRRSASEEERRTLQQELDDIIPPEPGQPIKVAAAQAIPALYWLAAILTTGGAAAIAGNNLSRESNNRDHEGHGIFPANPPAPRPDSGGQSNPDRRHQSRESNTTTSPSPPSGPNGDDPNGEDPNEKQILEDLIGISNNYLSGKGSQRRQGVRNRQELNQWWREEGKRLMEEYPNTNSGNAIPPAVSKIWSMLRTFKASEGLKQSIDGRYVFEYDRGTTGHGAEIEVYRKGSREHLGAIDPLTGKWVKPPVKGREQGSIDAPETVGHA